ncbi:protein-L-isoaspartate(D-aspartate) O-methyltransferase [Kribbella albertanoniae]|uniref:Protein-L-isoaspartate O-methyltransferase n=1 Tax=Kribbella albertanoniae TaxID=1266829 RepID=A0A4R4Q5Q4_9ACTN|nr:protein-L-isoaspartate(D-aspartate) O-methyltransferase [Kribbella albertanoniae]TDC30203.1 protein-L-isoaspartate(D-aspartate) O-methyltransferase [Kribbella albertanoniae]
MGSVVTDRSSERVQLVRSIAGRGVTDARVLAAMRQVRREAFVPPDLAEFAYRDLALPIESEQTISQPYIVALMTQALELEPHDRVLEIGTGSGYAAAVLSHVASEVFTIERHAQLAATARERLTSHGIHNTQVKHGDGRLGWPDHAPYDAIVVTAAAEAVPERLGGQLAIGGRLVIPVGAPDEIHELVRIRRTGADDFEEETLEQVRFVPLLPGRTEIADDTTGLRSVRGVPAAIAANCEPVEDLESVDLDGFLQRIGSARLVLLGEASHGTSEFYRMRHRITRDLIERAGFQFVAVEADWPDAARIDAYVRGAADTREPVRSAFQRFPQWMWRNADVLDFVDWLRAHNQEQPAHQVSFHGLDLYSMHDSMQRVVDYLEGVDPELAESAKRRYGCLTPYESDPAAYGLASLKRGYPECEHDVVTVLRELCQGRDRYLTGQGEAFLDAEQNAVITRDAERYYRAMYYGGAESWNIRDRHMFSTLQALIAFHGPAAKAVVWAHNSHLGDARATALSSDGQINLGQLIREQYGGQSYHLGFGTDHGTVLAAAAWGQEPQVMKVQPGRQRSYEQLFHQVEQRAFLLPLRSGHVDPQLRLALEKERLERAIGVVYRPQSELASHYFGAVLPEQFDEYFWYDETTAVTALPGTTRGPADPRHPFHTLDT